MSCKSSLRDVLPRWLISAYHLFYAWYGAWKYDRPSEQMMVIGVTGTSGKSSTIYFIKQILESSGCTVGALSTVEFCIAGKCELNDRKMTMLGRTEIQKKLQQMSVAGCAVALIETTSEGFVQHRHRFINYDAIILTNLYPEHIEAHGSFENYKAVKLGIFEYVSHCRPKAPRLMTARSAIPKTCIVNADSEYAPDFRRYEFNQKITFGRGEQTHAANQNLAANKIVADTAGVSFTVGDELFRAPIYGEHNVGNILAAIAVAKIMKLDNAKIGQAVSKLQPVPGRIEFIPEAGAHGFHVIVDYAFEPVAMAALYGVVSLFKPNRLIHVFGSTGGGRDVARRFTVGEFVAKRADICIITDEDPYDDDPMAIIGDVASAVRQSGKQDNDNLFIIPDRRAAIQKALQLAAAGDMVLVTGKGSEQAMVVGCQLIPWDDRRVVREELKKLPKLDKIELSIWQKG